MIRAMSTYVYVKERLHPGLLDGLQRAGAQAIEIFAARGHFDYANRKSQVKEMADWFKTSGVPLHSVHSPMYSDYEWGRSGSPPVNISATDKRERISAMDEIKRAIEVAARPEDLDGLSAGARQPVQQAGMQPLLHIHIRGHGPDHVP